MSGVCVRKELVLKEEDYNEIVDCLTGRKDKINTISIFHSENGYDLSVIIANYTVEKSLIIACNIYYKGKLKSIYMTTYTIDNIYELHNVYMLDTKNVGYNTLEIEMKDDVEFYFTFNVENRPKELNDRMFFENNQLMAQEGQHLVDNIALLNYIPFADENKLFLGLYSFLSREKEIIKLFSKKRRTKDEKYFISKYNFIIDKLHYYGYNRDYLEENLTECEELIFEYMENNKPLDNEEIFKIFMVLTLGLFAGKYFVGVDLYTFINKAYRTYMARVFAY